MNTKPVPARVRVAVPGLGPDQDPVTAPAGARVLVHLFTADRQFARISYGRAYGYTSPDNLFDYPTETK